MIAFNHHFALVTVIAASFASVACTQSTVEGPKEESKNETVSTGAAESSSSKTTANNKPTQPALSCPPVAQPMCDSGTELVSEKDPATGCTFISCKVVCPEIDIPACAATDELVTGNDENGCSYAYCKPAAEPANTP